MASDEGEAGSDGAARRFEAVVYKVGQLRCVDVPAEVSAAFGDGRIAVRVSVESPFAEGGEEQTSLVPTKKGGHRLFLAAGLRKSAGIDAGDPVTLRLRPDARGGESDLPPELVAALAVVPGGMEELLSRSPADRRQLVRFVQQPKSRDARRSRVAQAVKMVMRGKPKRKKR